VREAGKVTQRIKEEEVLDAEEDVRRGCSCSSVFILGTQANMM